MATSFNKLDFCFFETDLNTTSPMCLGHRCRGGGKWFEPTLWLYTLNCQGLNTQGRCRWLDTGKRDTGGHNEGGASNHTGGNNQEQGRRSQGQETEDVKDRAFKIRHKNSGSWQNWLPVICIPGYGDFDTFHLNFKYRHEPIFFYSFLVIKDTLNM